MTTATKANAKAEQLDAQDRLREILKPGMTVYTTLRHVSSSGMSRVIDVHVIQNNRPRWIGATVARALGWKYDDKKQGVRVGGCGMDIGFHLIYSLSRALYQDGFWCAGEGSDQQASCPSNDHSNGDRSYLPHPHRDGGYALRQEWL